MKALVAGGGIAGLATGIALRQAGFDVEIFERSTELREIGAGLMIWPNGARSLHALDVEIDALSLHTLSICTWRGRRLSRYPLNPIAQRFGFQPCFVHRADMQSALAARFGCGFIRFGTDVAAFTETSALLGQLLPVRKFFPECHRVFERLASALTGVWRHRVRGVTDQRHPFPAPMLHRRNRRDT